MIVEPFGLSVSSFVDEPESFGDASTGIILGRGADENAVHITNFKRIDAGSFDGARHISIPGFSCTEPITETGDTVNLIKTVKSEDANDLCLFDQPKGKSSTSLIIGQ